MNKPLISIIAMASFALATPLTASAQGKTGMVQPKGTSSVGKSKVYHNQKQRSEVNKMLSRDIKRTYAKIRTVETRLSDFQAALEASPGLRRESGAWRQVNAAINEHRALRKEMTALTSTRLSDYAARRGVSMVPNAPRTPPPPLPQTLQPPPAKSQLKDPKAKRPPRD